jgi:hypothetical protein
MNTLEGFYRHDLIKLLPLETNLIGVELGVAKGIFSKRMVESKKFAHFFGIDQYGDHHDTEEYKKALEYIGLFSNYKLLRMTFDEALDLFPDQSLDFVYIDGYAHTGEEGGETIYKWYNKIKVGGLLTGDDYHSDWPLVVRAVNEFSKEADLHLRITEITEKEMFCKYPSWAMVKTSHKKIAVTDSFLREGRVASEKERRKSIRRMFYLEFIRPWIPSIIISFLKRLKKGNSQIADNY